MINNLYVKQHNQTLLKYLGKTTQDPYKYKGSGIHWKRHLKIHGNDVDTYIIGTYETKEALKEAGLYYSKVWNVVKSDKWANLKLEEGDGGFSNEARLKAKLPESKEKMRQKTRQRNLINNPSKRFDVKEKISKNNGMKRPEVIAKRAKNWKVTNLLTGIVSYITNLNKFAQENNLKQGALTLVSQGKRYHHKGWRVSQI